MQKIMKSLGNKTIVVKLTKENVQEFDIDLSIFDDPFLEAATRAVEKSRKSKHGLIHVVTQCWEKSTPRKIKLYNSYFILVNAGCYHKAEQLREKVKMQSDCDLAKEPLHATDKSNRDNQ